MKGQVQIQFSWVFIAIAGAIILLFFGGLIVKQKSATDQKLSNVVANNLETIFTSTGISSGTVDVLEIPDRSFNFRCDGYEVGKSSTIPYNNKLIFAPSFMKGQELITLTLTWYAPFKVTNFLYLTMPTNRYIFSGDENKYSVLDRILPKKMNHEFNEDPNYKKHNYNRFIFLNSQPVMPSDFVDVNDNFVSALQIDDSTNTLTFYKKEGNKFNQTGKYNYLEDQENAFIIAAIYSDNPETFSCIMQKAFKRHSIISQIYESKATELKKSVYTACKPTYSLSLLNNYITECSNNLQICKFDSILQENTKLQQANDNLIIASCPPIY